MRMKDSFASSLLVLFFLALSIPLFRQDVFAEDAWMFRGNPAHSGVYEATGGLYVWRQAYDGGAT